MPETQKRPKFLDKVQSYDIDLEMEGFAVRVKPKPGASSKEPTYETYAIVELNGRDRDRYLTEVSARVKHSPQGQAAVKNFDGLQASLLAKCVHHATLNDDGEVVELGDLVDVKTIQQWPSRLISDLHDKATKAARLDKKAEDKEEND